VIVRQHQEENATGGQTRKALGVGKRKIEKFFKIFF